ncbi:MAG: hypothetical protein ACYC61_21485 [Isosphaeraceae bacterium]
MCHVPCANCPHPPRVSHSCKSPSGATAWSKVLDSRNPKARAAVAATLKHWKQDADLAGVRDGAALAALPETERGDWKALWAEVDRLLGQADKAS